MKKRDVEVYADAASMARAAAERFIVLGRQAIQSRGVFRAALSGGSTPRGMYARLADDAFSTQVDWSGVHLFWGDERCVPPGNSDSNYRIAAEAFIDLIPIPSVNVHRIKGELDPSQAAREYIQTLRRAFGISEGQASTSTLTQLPHFDLILLGMGADGHTASLFPGTAAIHEKQRWVAAHAVERLNGAWRVTLTPVILNAARQVLLLVSGAKKAQRLRDVLKGPSQPDLLPAQIVQPSDGHVTWMVDAPAAAKL